MTWYICHCGEGHDSATQSPCAPRVVLQDHRNAHVLVQLWETLSKSDDAELEVLAQGDRCKCGHLLVLHGYALDQRSRDCWPCDVYSCSGIR